MNPHARSMRLPVLLCLLLVFSSNQLFARQFLTADATLVTDTLTTEQERLLVNMLETSLQSLAAEDYRGRRIGGYAMLGLGAGAVVGGAATLAFGKGDDAKTVGYSLLGGGALLGGLSLVPFKIKTKTERLYEEFSKVPRNTQEEIHETYLYWDQRFASFADESRRDRIIGGITSITIGVLTGVVVLNGEDDNNLESSLWASLGPLLGGVSSLLIKSDVERSYETYQRAKSGVTGEPMISAVHVGVIPLPDRSLHAMVRVQF